jgi:hypothetical protein
MVLAEKDGGQRLPSIYDELGPAPPHLLRLASRKSLKGDKAKIRTWYVPTDLPVPRRPSDYRQITARPSSATTSLHHVPSVITPPRGCFPDDFARNARSTFFETNVQIKWRRKNPSPYDVYYYISTQHRACAPLSPQEGCDLVIQDWAKIRRQDCQNVTAIYHCR